MSWFSALKSLLLNAINLSTPLSKTDLRAFSLRRASSTTRATEEAMQDQLNAKDRKITSLRNQLTSPRQTTARHTWNWRPSTTRPSRRCRLSRRSASTPRRRARVPARGRCRDPETEERLCEEIAKVKQEHTKEVQDLGAQIKDLSAEIEASARLRYEADSSKQAIEKELARTKEQFQSHRGGGRFARCGGSLSYEPQERR